MTQKLTIGQAVKVLDKRAAYLREQIDIRKAMGEPRWYYQQEIDAIFVLFKHLQMLEGQNKPRMKITSLPVMAGLLLSP